MEGQLGWQGFERDGSHRLATLEGTSCLHPLEIYYGNIQDGGERPLI